jgi:omega-amidase
MNKITIGLCQLKVYHDKKRGLANAAAKIIEARKKGAQMIVLPEMWNCPYSTKYFRAYAESIPGGESCAMLSGLARKLKVFIVGGSIPELRAGKVYNSAPVFDPKGKLVAVHRKLHLFDVRLKGVNMRESDVLSAGEKPTVFRTPFGNMGLLICYDARFPELFRLMEKDDVRAVVMPGAFSKVTGSAHWHALIKIRAVDNQIYMIAVSPARDNRADYRAFGHSMIVDPWGTEVVSAGTKETVIAGTLLRSRLNEVRQSLPLLNHRREDLY